MDTNDRAGGPGAHLLEHARDLAPGVALVLGCADGADVVWLAERGWRVTGVDADETALERARRRAGEAGVADRTSWRRGGEELPAGADLVAVHDEALPPGGLGAVAEVVRHGGTLLVAGSSETATLGSGWQVDGCDGHVVARRSEA